MITIKEIAKQAKVSIATVDRVLHKRGSVSQETREKINEIIKLSGYKTNIFARHLKLSKTFQIAVLMPEKDQDSKFWEIIAFGIEKAKQELSVYNIQIIYFNYNRFSKDSFIETSHKILQTEYDGILIAPVLSKFAKYFINEIPHNVPYVFFNVNIPETNSISFIGQDSYQSGKVAAKLMKQMTYENGEIAIIKGSSDEDYHHSERARGFQSFFQNNNNFIIKVYNMDGFTDKQSYFNLMKNVIEENKKLKGIFVTDASCHYVAEYLKTYKINNSNICLIGYDLVEENINYLNEEIIDFLISQKAEEQGYRGIYSLYRNLVLREFPEKNIMMPIDIITKENLTYYK